MAEPKISVLIPMYNRKHYISDAVNSVLNQTFQDFEIIIRDNCSTDGSFEFVQEKYAKEISSGKIKLARNYENLGEFGNVRQCFLASSGKYIQILHSDDFLMPYGLQHMYETAERFNADVVHSVAHFTSEEDGTIKDKALQEVHDQNVKNEIEILPADQKARFMYWHQTDVNSQYNLYRRQFILENDIFKQTNYHYLSLNFFSLWWMMLAKVVVKTPVIYYFWRKSPSSSSYTEIDNAAHVAWYVSFKMELSRLIDELIPQVEIFKDNENIRRYLRIQLFINDDGWQIFRRGIYRNGISVELYEAVENSFKKYLGEDACYPAFLFNWIHSSQCGHNLLQAMLKDALDSIPTAPPKIDYLIFEAA